MFFLRDYVPNSVLKKAVSLVEIGSDEPAWDKQSTLEIIEALDNANIGIFGGGVCEVLDDGIDLTCDSWYTNRNKNENDKTFFHRGKVEAKKYIEHYPIHERKILFTITFTCLVNFSLQEEELF